MTRLADSTLAIVGPGRVGHALARAFGAAGIEVEGPLGRGHAPTADIVLLCVPDAEIANAAAGVDARFVGHVSGATPLDVLGAPEAFGLHPLQTVTGSDTDFAGCGCAIAGSTPEALELARGPGLGAGVGAFANRGSAPGGL